MIAITIMTVWNIIMAIGIIILDKKTEKENAELIEKNIWQARKIRDYGHTIIRQRKIKASLEKKINNQRKQLRNIQKKSIVRERTIETENTI